MMNRTKYTAQKSISRKEMGMIQGGGCFRAASGNEKTNDGTVNSLPFPVCEGGSLGRVQHHQVLPENNKALNDLKY